AASSVSALSRVCSSAVFAMGPLRKCFFYRNAVPSEETQRRRSVIGGGKGKILPVPTDAQFCASCGRRARRNARAQEMGGASQRLAPSPAPSPAVSPAPSPGSQAADKLGQRAHSHARRALDQVMASLLGGCRAGDVEVRPAGLVDELADDKGTRDGAGGPAAGVLDVGDVALVLLLVLGVRRQAAEALAGLTARR